MFSLKLITCVCVTEGTLKFLILYYMSVCRSRCVPTRLHIVMIESEDQTLPEAVIDYLKCLFHH